MSSSRQMRYFMLPVLMFIILLLLAMPSFRLHGQAEFPTVYAVFFFSPTCPHCHNVIQEDLPVFEAEFGDSLQIIPVDVTQDWGSSLYYSACAVLDTQDKCGGVPLLVVSDVILVGEVEIPERLPGITRAGLEAGGLAMPEFPGSSDLLAAWQRANSEAAAQETTAETADDPVEETSATEPEAAIVDTAALETLDTKTSLADRLQADPEANALAILILAGLLFSVGWMAWQRYGADVVNLQMPALIVAGLLGLGLAISLISHEGEDSAATVIAYGLVGLLGLVLFLIPLPQMHTSYAVPLVIIAGIAVASYLTHIETSETSAVCGLIGDCNTVQQSDYARLFGVLPVGVLGVLAYLMIFAIWGAARVPSLDAGLRHKLETLLMVLVLAGTIFSAYLTFLEPFVIGATCAWCLTSAVTMLLLLWLIVPAYFEQSSSLTTQKS